MILLQFSVDSGMIVVIFICLGYLLLVIGLLFFVKNDWCDLLFRNMTVGFYFFFIFQMVVLTNSIWIPLWHCHYCPKWHPFVLFRKTWSVDPRATTRSVNFFVYLRWKLVTQVGIMVSSDLINLSSKERRREWKRITSTNNHDPSTQYDLTWIRR